MVCGNCKYFNDGLCSKHGTIQLWNCETSCGEYEMWDEENQVWVDGKEFYKKKGMSMDNLEQKEWNEQDDRILYNVIAYIGFAAGARGVRNDAFKEANIWLKSLKSRFQK